MSIADSGDATQDTEKDSPPSKPLSGTRKLHKLQKKEKAFLTPEGFPCLLEKQIQQSVFCKHMSIYCLKSLRTEIKEVLKGYSGVSENSDTLRYSGNRKLVRNSANKMHEV